MSENAGLQLPFGRLSYDSGNTSFVITLPVLRSIAPIEQSVQRLLTRLKGDQWLRPELEVEGSQVRLRYRWPEELYPVSEVASKWRSSTRRNLPHWFHLAECLLTASSCMMPVGLFPFTPATVFVTASGNKREALGFKFAAIPALSFGLKDWAAADPLTWQWTNPGAFLRPDDFDGKYAAAAALHFCLVGSLVPEHLPNREQFLRFLSGRTGREGLFQKYFGEALPDSMKDEEAATLSQKLVQALRRHPSAAQEGEEGLFAYAQKNITVLRLANRWEYESRPDEALQLWLDHEKWNGPQEVSWWRVARLCERLGRRQEAEQSIFKGLQLEQEDLLEKATELILSRLQKTGRGRSDFSDMRPLIEQCDQIIAAGQMPSEQHDLRAAHLFLKYGGDTEAAVQRLKTPASDAWQKVQQNLFV
ncbi:MAG: hypothetical protein IPM81_02035 [Saprospirales bacterium]|nr:hypothetical protein [Saprospirales bacterium]